jgi:hypothetical protein
MMNREHVYVSRRFRQRGTGKELDRNKAIVFDFMPVLIGDEFRLNDILNKQLFREPPVRGPMMLAERAYTLLGERYLKEKKLVSALECYKFALYEQTSFISFISAIQKNALLSPDELSHLELGTPLEKALLKSLAKQNRNVNSELYCAWIERLRAGYELECQYNRDSDECWKRSNLELQLELGMWGNDCVMGVDYHARELGDKNLMARVRISKPKEILDTKWLKKFMDDNHPESSL